MSRADALLGERLGASLRVTAVREVGYRRARWIRAVVTAHDPGPLQLHQRRGHGAHSRARRGSRALSCIQYLFLGCRVSLAEDSAAGRARGSGVGYRRGRKPFNPGERPPRRDGLARSRIRSRSCIGSRYAPASRLAHRRSDGVLACHGWWRDRARPAGRDVSGRLSVRCGVDRCPGARQQPARRCR